MVQGKTYRLKSSGHYLRPEERGVEGGGKREVEVREGNGEEEEEEEEVEVSWEKMSKSKYNGVDPEVHVYSRTPCHVYYSDPNILMLVSC